MVKQNAVVSVSDSNVPQSAINEYGKYSNETIETFVLEDDCMTSLQLAHLKGIRHSDMLRDIRKMEETWVKLGLRKFALSTYINSQSKEQPMYKLDKKQSVYIMSKWNDELRLKIINRWEDLEKKERMPSYVIEDPIERAKAWIAELEEHKKELEAKDKENLALENKVESLEVELADAENEFVKVGKQYGIKDRKNASKGYMAVGKFNETNFFKQHCKDYKAEKFYHALIELGLAVKDGDGIYRHTNDLNGLLETAYTYRGKVDEPIGYCVRFDVSRSAELWEIIKPKMELKKKSAKCSTISN